MDWVWLWLVMLDTMMREAWHVTYKVFGRLCVNFWSCGCVLTFGRVVVCQPSIICPM
jgi:hypothetical protein